MAIILSIIIIFCITCLIIAIAIVDHHQYCPYFEQIQKNKNIVNYTMMSFKEVMEIFDSDLDKYKKNWYFDDDSIIYEKYTILMKTHKDYHKYLNYKKKLNKISDNQKIDKINNTIKNDIKDKNDDYRSFV